jgi:hypothetical protein
LLASFWVLAHEPQQIMVMTHITTATAYDSTTVMSGPPGRERLQGRASALPRGSSEELPYMSL